MLALLLLSCSDCPTFEETTIVAEAGLGAEERRAIEQAVGDLQAWTGLDGACVDRIEVVDDGTTGWAGGTWSGAQGRIRIDAGAGPTAMASTTRHELCHAIDGYLGLSATAPEVFDGEDMDIDWEHYGTTARRRGEHFARACALGPVPTALLDVVVAECGASPSIGDDQLWLMEHLFLDPLEGAWEGTRIELALGPAQARRALDETLEWPVVAVGLAWTLHATTLGQPETGELFGDLSLRASDPVTRSPQVEVPLPGPWLSIYELSGFELRPGDDGLYVVSPDEGAPLLRVDATGGVAILPRLHAATEEELWAVHDSWAYVRDRSDRQLYRRRLGETAREAVPLPLDGARLAAEDLQLRDGRLRWIQGFAEIVELDLATLGATVIPAPPGGWLYLAQPLGEGAWLGQVAAHSGGLVGVAWDGEAWRLPADPCLVEGEDLRLRVVDLDGQVRVEGEDGSIAPLSLR